jgi:hypothetical protein
LDSPFLDFSVIFNRFYKLQLKHKKRVRCKSRTGPWKEFEVHRYTPGLHKQPWEELQPRNVVLGPRGGAAGRIPARPAAGIAGEEVRRALGAPRSSMVAGVGVWRRRRGVHNGARELRPRQAQCRLGNSTVGATSDTGSFSMCSRTDLRG